MKWLLAIAVLVTLPVVQLRIAAAEPTCCCPKPALCKCPAHAVTPAGDTPTMKPCGEAPPPLAVASLAAFAPPVTPRVISAAVASANVLFVHAAPHAAPSPRRLAAPS